MLKIAKWFSRKTAYIPINSIYDNWYLTINFYQFNKKTSEVLPNSSNTFQFLWILPSTHPQVAIQAFLKTKLAHKHLNWQQFTRRHRYEYISFI